MGGGQECLSVGLRRCGELGGSWLGPKLPSAWRRLEGLSSPCYAGDRSTEEVHCFPLVMNIAPMKSGTSDVYNRVFPHPSIVLAQQPPELEALDDAVNNSKEPKYWLYALGSNLSLEVYAKVYAGLSDAVASGGVAAAERKRLMSLDFSAMTFETNPALIQAVVPEARFVAFLRNPIDRAISHYNFEFTKHVNTSKCADMYKVRSADIFHDNAVQAVEKYKSCMAEGHSARECWQFTNRWRVVGCKNHKRTASYVLDSLYGAYLPWFQEYYPSSSFFVRRLEDIDFGLDRDRAQATQEKLLRFMGLGDVELPLSFAKKTRRRAHWHVKSVIEGYVRMHNSTRALLQEFYSPDVKLLQESFGDPSLAWW